MKIQEKEMHIATALEETINCRHYVPAWAGNKTTSSQPDWCLKHGVILNGKCLKNCNEKKDVRNNEL